MGNLIDGGGIVGYVSLECYDCDGILRWRDESKNMITDVGDAYYAAMAIVGVSPHNASAPGSKAVSMKLGNGTASTDSKSGNGAGVEGYVTGSVKAFMTGNPSVSGNVVTYVTSFDPGEGTATGISNVAICLDSSNATTGASGCIARKKLTATRDKQLGDTLIATWTHTFTGS